MSAPSAILINLESGTVFFERNTDTRRAMASTTKIMTAILVLERLKLNTKVTASARAEATNESQMDLRQGEVRTVKELLEGLLVDSANDAAVALAEACSGNVEAFVSQMNAKANELGLKNTHFTNPHGLDASGHYSSARDLATLARYAMKNPEFCTLVKTHSCSIPGPSGGTARTLTNTNLLLDKADWVTGVKTGFTDDAGYCLVASGTKNGVSVLSVVLGESSSEARWHDSEDLLEYGFAKCRLVTVIDKGKAVALADVPDVPGEKLKLVTSQPLEVNLSPGDKMVITIKLDRTLKLPVRAGDAFGTLKITAGGSTLDSVELLADRSYERPNLGSRLVHLFR
jgi:D-alanyl-D-alanine carboxypeptidase (penicillin-binding protein 5/6)